MSEDIFCLLVKMRVHVMVPMCAFYYFAKYWQIVQHIVNANISVIAALHGVRGLSAHGVLSLRYVTWTL